MFGVESASMKHSVVHFWLLIRQNSTSGVLVGKPQHIVSLLHQIQPGKLITDTTDQPTVLRSSSSRMYLAKTEHRNCFQNIWIVNKGVFGTRDKEPRNRRLGRRLPQRDPRASKLHTLVSLRLNALCLK